MDVTFDGEKNRRNIRLRGLPLSLGGVVLDDWQRIERYDDKHSTPEEARWQTIGRADEILFMVYMERGDMPHIIAVRLADSEEGRLYYGDSNFQTGGWYRVNPGGTGHA